MQFCSRVAQCHTIIFRARVKANNRYFLGTIMLFFIVQAGSFMSHSNNVNVKRKFVVVLATSSKHKEYAAPLQEGSRTL